MIGGPLADVEAAMRAGVETAGDTVLDHFTIQRVHEQLPAAIKGIVKVEGKEALGLIETKEVASAIYAADAAVKAAAVWLIEARNQAGGKGLVVLAGDVGAVRAAVAAGVETIRKEGMLIAAGRDPLRPPRPPEGADELAPSRGDYPLIAWSAGRSSPDQARRAVHSAGGSDQKRSVAARPSGKKPTVQR